MNELFQKENVLWISKTKHEIACNSTLQQNWTNLI